MPQQQPYCVDDLMRNVAITLVRDFRTGVNDPNFCLEFESSLSKAEIESIRLLAPETSETMSIPVFKRVWQVSQFLKRYRFSKDLYSDLELEKKAIESFKETQDRISRIDLESVSCESKTVLDLAKIYIAKVLGEYSDEEHRSLCRFGKRASVGISARKACEAERWEIPVTGSQNQIAWFDSEMSQIDCVQDYWKQLKGSDLNRSTYRTIDSLQLTLVPKTFKSLRSIMPNSTIGSYMSYGLGEMMTRRLKRNGYNIATLQERHKVLARRGSEHGCFTTADLSSASDSISVALVDRLFPPEWCEVLHQSRIGVVGLPDGSFVESKTFCTMGIGYTFPLQTLVFLSLLKAILFLVKGKEFRGTISVYGDDMIYTSSIHQTVVRVFEELGFVINIDKTFHEGGFRESCGGDYYHGVDVRPFCPKIGQTHVGRKTYEAILYKLINGMLRRWSEYEVEGTLEYLASELSKRAQRIRVVPTDFPDDSGIKCAYPELPLFLKGRTDVAKPKHVGHGVFRFSYLSLVPDLREEKRHEPYLWLALRVPDYTSRVCGSSQGSDLSTASIIEVSTNISSYTPSLLWKECKTSTVRSKANGRLCRLLSYVTVSHTGKYKRQSGASCFGAPQNRTVP